jgi:hypothetical protein
MGNQLRQVSFSSLAVVIGFGGNLFTKDSYGYGMDFGLVGGESRGNHFREDSFASMPNSGMS